MLQDPAANHPLYTFVLQQLPTVLEMHGQWLIVLLAGLFPSARGFGSVRQGCCFQTWWCYVGLVHEQVPRLVQAVRLSPA